MKEPNRHAYRDRKGKIQELFPIARGFDLYDGLGNSLGSLGGRKIPGRPAGARGVKVNYRQKKRMTVTDANGNPVVRTFVYALATVPNGSGWIMLQAIHPAYRKHFKGRPINARPPIKCRGKKPIRYCIVGKEEKDAPRRYRRKVVPCSGKQSEQVGDYLTRPSGVVNLLYALPGAGGVSNDSFPVSTTTFWRVHPDCTPKEAVVNIYKRCSKKPTGQMRFVYGYVMNTDGTRRYGWIAKETLKRGPC
jgi:hypothetical protein